MRIFGQKIDKKTKIPKRSIGSFVCINIASCTRYETGGPEMWRHRVNLSRGATRRVGLETDAKTKGKVDL
jgi:hypothetical protein